MQYWKNGDAHLFSYRKLRLSGDGEAERRQLLQFVYKLVSERTGQIATTNCHDSFHDHHYYYGVTSSTSINDDDDYYDDYYYANVTYVPGDRAQGAERLPDRRRGAGLVWADRPRAGARGERTSLPHYGEDIEETTTTLL